MKAAALKATVIRDGKAREYEIGSANELLIELEAAGARMPYGCRAGACGACRVLVRAGAEGLSPVDAMERDTLDRCGNDPATRLACRARAAGPVTVEIPPDEE